MEAVVVAVIVIVAVVVLGLLLSIRVVQQYEMGVHFRLGRVIGLRASRGCGRSCRSSICSGGCRCGS